MSELCFERYRHSVPYVAQSVSTSALRELGFLRTPQESKRQAAAAISLAKLSSEDVPVQVLVAKLALGIVAPAQFDEFGHLLVNTLEFRRGSCE